MCEVIQLLYSNECTRDQYSFNEQMRTGTGPALVVGNSDSETSVYLEFNLLCILPLLFWFVLI